MLGASLLAVGRGGTMNRRKRSSTGRGRLSVDVGEMKPGIFATAEGLGVTASDFIRDALRDYYEHKGGVSGVSLAYHRLYLSDLGEKFQRVRANPTDPNALADFQEAFDAVQWDAAFLERRNTK